MSKASARKISSDSTYLSKYLLVILFAVISLFFASAPILWPGLLKIGKTKVPMEPYSLHHLWTAFATFALAAAFAYYFGRLRDVWMDNQTLWARAYFTEIEVPLKDIADIRVNYDGLPSITLVLAKKTRLGKEIWFIPRDAYKSVTGKETMANEIKKLVSGRK